MGIKDALTFRSRLLEAGGCSYRAVVVTEVQKRGYTFTLDAVCAVGQPTELTVTAPETIRGITAQISDLETRLSFGDTALDFGILDDAMASPLYAPYVLEKSWSDAYINSGGVDDESYRVSYLLGFGEDELTVETWFEQGVPVRAEIYSGETLLLSAVIEGFTFMA